MRECTRCGCATRKCSRRNSSGLSAIGRALVRLRGHAQRERVKPQAVDLQDLVPLLRRAAAQHGTNAGMQLAHIAGLDHVIVGAGIECRDLGARVAVARQHDDRQAARVRAGTQGQQHVDRLAFRPVPLHQQQVRLRCLHRGLRLRRTVDALGVVSAIAQGQRQSLPLSLVLFNQQDLNAHL